MAALRTVVVVLLLWASLSDAAVNKIQLARYVTEVLRQYQPTYRVQATSGLEPPMFSLAISIPHSANDVYDFNQVITADPPQNVVNALNKCQVYRGTRVVAATLLKYPDFTQQCPEEAVSWDYVTRLCPNIAKWKDFADRTKCTNGDIRRLKNQADGDGLIQHAEYRVLQNIQHLTSRINRGDPATALRSSDLLLFYTYKSPCNTRCCSTDSNFSILTKMQATVRSWNNYAVVFSKLFVPGRSSDSAATQEQTRRNAITQLGSYIGGHNHIYRCTQGATSCISCNAGAGVDNDCVRFARSSSVPSRP